MVIIGRINVIELLFILRDEFWMGMGIKDCIGRIDFLSGIIDGDLRWYGVDVWNRGDVIGFRVILSFVILCVELGRYLENDVLDMEL